MKPATIFTVGLILVIVVFSIVTYIQVAVFAAATITLLLIFAAMSTHFRESKELSLRLEAPARPTALVPTVVIQGKQFTLSRNTEVRGRTILANLPYLVGTMLYSASCFWIVLTHASFTRQIDMNDGLYFAFYFLAYIGVIPLFLAGRFLMECKLLKGACVTMGFIQQHIAFRGSHLCFEFRDTTGGYYGDTSANRWGTTRDNALLVFFRCENPNINKAAPSLFFHRVKLSAE